MKHVEVPGASTYEPSGFRGPEGSISFRPGAKREADAATR